MTSICLDGIDGAGKTTQVKLLQRYFLHKGYEVVVFKPFHFIRPLIERFNGKVRILTNMLKQEKIHNLRQNVHRGIIERVMLSVSFAITLVLVIAYLVLEKILKKIIYSTNAIVIYDRFYFDKLIPKNRSQYKLCCSILKQIITEQCIILDVPTQLAYKRMKDVHDKYMPKRYYDILRKWYRVCAKLLSLPVIYTSRSSPIEIHAMIISFIENKSGENS